MSDGPHRSLPLRRAWKKVCEIADGRAHAIEEVVEQIPAALAADAKGEIGESLLKRLRQILTSDQPQLIDDTPQQVAALRSQAASVMEIDLVEAVTDALRDGKRGADAFQTGAEAVVEERGQAVTRSVVEHYLRKSPLERAAHVEQRVSDALKQAGERVRDVATGIVTGVMDHALSKAVDRSGLDDGPALA
ncbi:MAG: hypothetical protein EON59_02160 [Alphaproteobacteria bacterium]|nr:MAG: hypothetical protein EON59_02160 [Alphaproteobacteria bacterium]